MTESLITLSLLAAIVCFAAFEQTLSGFGFTLIVMPFATMLLGIQTAAPFGALVGLTLYALNLLRYRQALDWARVARLGSAAALGVPIGIWLVINLDARAVKTALGALLILFAMYTLARPRAGRALSPRWIYLAGFLSGCLGGAYNTPGPPTVVYGSLQQWRKEEFRAILQALFLTTASLTVAAHAFTQHLTPNVLTLYASAVPALIVGNLTAAWADRWVNKERFRVVVTVMILVLGLSLMI
jgi:uncharacterized membrane protein YfcA